MEQERDIENNIPPENETVAIKEEHKYLEALYKYLDHKVNRLEKTLNNIQVDYDKYKWWDSLDNIVKTAMIIAIYIKVFL